MADHRPSSYWSAGARSAIGGQLLQLWLGNFFFFKSPSWIYPTSDHMRWWSYHWGQLFSEQNQPWPSMLDSSIIGGGTSKTRLHQMALSAWKATAQQSISDSAIQSSVKGMQRKGGGGERVKRKERHHFFVGTVEATVPAVSTRPLPFYSNAPPPLKVKPLLFFLPSSVIFLGAFQKLKVSY